MLLQFQGVSLHLPTTHHFKSYLGSCNHISLYILEHWIMESSSFAPLCFLLSLPDSHPISPMASNFDNSLVGTPLLPTKTPRWWQPATWWVAVLHLPVRLHLPAILAPLVAQFGSMVSLCYPSNFKDKNILMILVNNCFITRIPHILSVREGDRVFPIRTQVVFQPKFSGGGIIFDPIDLGDSFCTFFSAGQVPAKSVLQNGPVLSSASYSIPLARDKEKNKSVSEVDMAPLQHDRNANTLSNSLPHTFTMFSSSTFNSPLGPTNSDHVLNHNHWKLTGTKDPIFEGDQSSYIMSHREDSVGRFRKDSLNNLSSCQDNDISVIGKSHHLSTPNGLTKTKELLPIISPEVQFPKHRNIKESDVYTQSTLEFKCGTTLELPAPTSEKKKRCRYASPPIVYKRRSIVRVPFNAAVQESSQHATIKVVSSLGEIGREV